MEIVFLQARGSASRHMYDLDIMSPSDIVSRWYMCLLAEHLAGLPVSVLRPFRYLLVEGGCLSSGPYSPLLARRTSPTPPHSQGSVTSYKPARFSTRFRSSWPPRPHASNPST